MKKIFACLFFLFAAAAIYAQSADVITEIIQSEEVNFGQICYLSAVQQGFAGEDVTYEQAVQVLYENNQLPENVYEYNSVAMADLACIYAQMWNIKGGIMYRLTKASPRYAFKLLKNDGIIPQNADPTTIVTGPQALDIYTACAIRYGKQKVSLDEEDLPAAEAQ